MGLPSFREVAAAFNRRHPDHPITPAGACFLHANAVRKLRKELCPS
jgi:hypothetical protein